MMFKRSVYFTMGISCLLSHTPTYAQTAAVDTTVKVMNADSTVNAAKEAKEAKEEKGEKEAMCLGGLLTMDGASKLGTWEKAQANLSRVELSSVVSVGDDLEGSISFLAEPDTMFDLNQAMPTTIYQAVGQWTLPQVKIIFGRQAFNLSLLSTRMTTLPLMFTFGEFRNNGLTVLSSQGLLRYGAGISSIVTHVNGEATSDPVAIVNADFVPEGQITRLGLEISKERQAADLATNLVLGNFLIDAEGMWRWKDEDRIDKGGFALGLAYNFTEQVALAGRWDGMINEQDAADPLSNEDGLTHQYFAGCLTVFPIAHVYGAAEIGWDNNLGTVFDFQVGLQSTLKLPGFQHKTLNR